MCKNSPAAWLYVRSLFGDFCKIENTKWNVEAKYAVYQNMPEGVYAIF